MCWFRCGVSAKLPSGSSTLCDPVYGGFRFPLSAWWRADHEAVRWLHVLNHRTEAPNGSSAKCFTFTLLSFEPNDSDNKIRELSKSYGNVLINNPLLSLYLILQQIEIIFGTEQATNLLHSQVSNSLFQITSVIPYRLWASIFKEIQKIIKQKWFTLLTTFVVVGKVSPKWF